MGGGVKSRRVGGVCGADADDDGRKRPKHVELKKYVNKITFVASSWYHSLIVMIKMSDHTALKNGRILLMN
jgi:hypothetical protein